MAAVAVGVALGAGGTAVVTGGSEEDAGLPTIACEGNVRFQSRTDGLSDDGWRYVQMSATGDRVMVGPPRHEGHPAPPVEPAESAPVPER